MTSILQYYDVLQDLRSQFATVVMEAPGYERWQAQYEQMMAFMKENHRRPSKHRLEEHDMLNWYKHTKKMIARGDYPADRIAKFKILQDIADEYRRLNQYI